MKKIILIGCIAMGSLFAENIAYMSETDKTIGQDERIKGVVLESYGIVVEENSALENELKEVLIKYKKIESKKEPVIVLEPIVVTAKTINLAACVSCHGKEFEKVALGKSKVVKDLSKEEIEKSLIGYKDGTYGGTMKGLMKTQVSKYTNDEIKEIAKEIKGE